MSMLNYWINGLWNANKHYLFDDEGEPLSADRVRPFMMEYLDTEPQSHRNARILWHPLSPEQKQEALLSAFPDGRTYQSDDEF